MSKKQRIKSRKEIIQQHRQLQHLLQSASLEESGAPKLVINTILVTAVIIGFIIVWAGFSNVEEISSAKGEIIPDGEIDIIQHFEGGIISNILVKDGQEIREGQALISLAPSNTLAELKRLSTRAISLKIDIARLDAFVRKQLWDKEQFTKTVGIPENVSAQNYNKLISNAIELLEKQHQTRENQRDILKKRVHQLTEDIANLEEQKTNLASRVNILQDEVGMYTKLAEQKTVSQVRLLNSKDRFSETQGEYLEVLGALQSNKNALLEAQANLNNLDAQYIEDALTDRAQINSELLEVEDLLSASRDKADRLEVKSPVHGIVKGFDLDVGSVIPPGGKVMEIVPLNKPLVVEARVKTDDIGHLKVGDHVNVKVSAYDFARYGQLTGELISLSASTFLDEDRVPYYKATISLDKHYLGENPEHYKILPGMTVTADIITGKKSILSYILKPVQASLQNAFRER